MKRRCRSCCNVCLLLLGIALISLGLTIFVYFEALYDYVISSAMTFTPKTEPFRVWRVNDPPLVMDIYLFNWTNPQDLLVKGVKPRFEEIGPYKFKEVKEKVNITWHDNNHTISYRHKKSYYFDAENSVRNLSDVITTINVVPLVSQKFCSLLTSHLLFSRPLSSVVPFRPSAHDKKIKDHNFD
jgi:hypothetical protein